MNVEQRPQNMMSPPPSQRVLLFTPCLTQLSSLSQALEQEEIPVIQCQETGDLQRRLAEGPATVIVAEEALAADTSGQLSGPLAAQAGSSNFAVIVMISAHRRSGDLAHLLPKGRWGHWLVLEQPVEQSTLALTIKSVLHSPLNCDAGLSESALLAEAVPAAIACIDQERRYRFVNRSFEQWFGVSRGSLIGRAAPEILGDIWNQRPHNPIRPLDEVKYEKTIAGHDGRQQTALIRFVPRPPIDGLPSGYYVIVTDVTEFKTAQKDLEWREQQQHAIAELSQAALSGLHLPNLMKRCSATLASVLAADYCAILELLPENDFLKLRCGAGWDPDHLDAAMTEAGPGTLAGFTIHNEAPVTVTDFAAESRFSAEPLLVSHGATAGISCVIKGTGQRPWGVLMALTRQPRTFNDLEVHLLQAAAAIISNTIHRITTELALRESRQRLALAHMASSSGAWEVDLITGARLWSPEMYDLYGVNPVSPQTAANLFDPVHEDDRERIRGYLRSVVRNREQVWNIEFRILHPAAGIRWIAGLGKIYYDQAGSALRMVGIDVDITARKTAEEKAKRAVSAYALSAGLIKGQEEERRRIALDLHDDYVQRLGNISLQLDQLCLLSGEMDEVIRPLKGDLDQLADDLRRLSHQLHPSILDHLGLPAAIQDECDRLSNLKGIPTFPEINGIFSDLHKELQLCIYRVAQEAFHNIAKHAQATQVGLSLERTVTAIHFNIYDDGIGFDPEADASHDGLGLSTMRERLRPFDGTFCLRSQPGMGTSIEIVIPLTGAAPSRDSVAPPAKPPAQGDSTAPPASR